MKTIFDQVGILEMIEIMQAQGDTPTAVVTVERNNGKWQVVQERDATGQIRRFVCGANNTEAEPLENTCKRHAYWFKMGPYKLFQLNSSWWMGWICPIPACATEQIDSVCLVGEHPFDDRVALLCKNCGYVALTDVLDFTQDGVVDANKNY